MVGWANRMEKLQRYFLWGGMGNEFKFHLVNWDTFCTPVSRGGLGIKKLLLFNKALLGKWLWHYVHEDMALWRWVIEFTYVFSGQCWCTSEVKGTYGVGLPKYIRSGWDSFTQFIRYDVGDGPKVQFWHDLWHGETHLKERYPNLCLIARQSEATVADYVECKHERLSWIPVFNRAVQDWKVNYVAKLLKDLSETKIRFGEIDKLVIPSPN